MAENTNKSATPVALTFIVLIATASYMSYTPRFVLWIYLGASLITFLIYAKDKSAAKKGKWRTSEQTLHVYSFLCGWPGALLAQQWLRHKSQKKSFRIVFWLTVVLNLGLLVWTHTNHGKAYIQSLLEFIK